MIERIIESGFDKSLLESDSPIVKYDTCRYWIRNFDIDFELSKGLSTLSWINDIGYILQARTARIKPSFVPKKENSEDWELTEKPEDIIIVDRYANNGKSVRFFQYVNMIPDGDMSYSYVVTYTLKELLAVPEAVITE